MACYIIKASKFFLNFGDLMDLKRIQTPHRFIWVFGAEKTFATRWSGGRVQVRAAACHLAITPEGYSRRELKVLTAKSMAELLRARFGTAWAGRTDEIKHRAFSSQRQSLRAATGSLRKTCYHPYDTDSVRELKWFYCFLDIWPRRVTLFFM